MLSPGLNDKNWGELSPGLSEVSPGLSEVSQGLAHWVQGLRIVSPRYTSPESKG